MLLCFIKDRAGAMIAFVCFAVIFPVLAFLYGMPLDGIAYGIAICAVVCGLVGAVDYLGYLRRHRALLSLVNSISNGASLPEPGSLCERDYQLLLETLREELVGERTKSRVTSSEMKDFYALWVHQIKTPISAMSLLLQDDEGKNARTLRSELFKIERYTEIVLNYLRLEDISSDLAVSYTSLEQAVKQTVKKFAPVFISKGVSVSLDGLDVQVLTDEKWLVFALEQLVSNSLKYTPAGGSISFSAADGPTLVIKDSGIGISAEDLPRIFEKGFTGYNGRMDKKATGLGLYLTKKTLDKLGHGIKISSDGTSGTTVRVDISRRKAVYE